VDELVDWTTFARMRTQLGASFVRILGYFREDGEKAVLRIEEAMHRQDAAGLVLPAHTLKAEARQFGAEPVEGGFFPDNILPQVAELRPLYQRTVAALEAETNPLATRRQTFGRGPSNQEFGRL
jgi:hypothetical protein